MPGRPTIPPSTADADDAWAAASDITARLRRPSTSRPAWLDEPIAVQVAWFTTAKPAYDEDPLGVGIVLARAIPALGNPRARRDAMAHAAPQWRPAGLAHVQVGRRSFTIIEAEDRHRIEYSAVCHLHHHLLARRLEVHTATRPPCAFTGPWAPHLAVLLVHAVTGRVLDLPAAPPTPTVPSAPPPLPHTRRRRFDWLIG